MKKLITNVALYQDHSIKEGKNIAFTDDRITDFPDHPDRTAYDEIIDGNRMLSLIHI